MVLSTTATYTSKLIAHDSIKMLPALILPSLRSAGQGFLKKTGEFLSSVKCHPQRAALSDVLILTRTQQSSLRSSMGITSVLQRSCRQRHAPEARLHHAWRVRAACKSNTFVLLLTSSASDTLSDKSIKSSCWRGVLVDMGRVLTHVQTRSRCCCLTRRSRLGQHHVALTLHQ